MKESDVLDALAWAEKHFGSLTTNRHLPRRDVMRAVKKGLAKSIGMAVLCDDDGFHIEPERYCEGFILTEAGRKRIRMPTASNNKILIGQIEEKENAYF